MSTQIDRTKLAEMVAKLKAARLASSLPAAPSVPPATVTQTPIQEAVRVQHIPTPEESRKEDFGHIFDKYGNLITLNDKQKECVNLALSGKSFVLIGAAGTGKTTTQRAVTQALSQAGMIPPTETLNHKHLVSGTPGILITAYTRRATANIRRNMSAELQSNCITLHKALEYQPHYYDVIDPATGETKTTMRFEPSRSAANPLPSSIKVIVIEEASMVGVPLHQELEDANPHAPQFIYLGDIQQLPPVFGAAILGYKLLELPVIELTEVYRQALDSPIISLAHRILSGNPIPASEYPSWKKEGQLTIRQWTRRVDPITAVNTLGAFFTQAYDAGQYDPEEDIILIPFNKACGTDELNLLIANHLARKRGATTHQIIAGFRKLHLSVGDKVLYDKEDAIITAIERNPSYGGAEPLPPSTTLDYWGHDPAFGTGEAEEADPMDFLLLQTAADSEDRVKKSSHRITLQMMDSDVKLTIDTAGDVNSLLLAYSLTIHKSQGSEWRKVFLCIHQSHATMVQRELLYTAVTRAREELYIICEPDTFTKGILSQRIKGNTLEEKAEFFKGKKERDSSEKLS